MTQLHYWQYFPNTIFYSDKKIQNYVPFEHYEGTCIAQKMKFSINGFFSKCDRIRSFLPIWSQLLKKYLMENVIFCAVLGTQKALRSLSYLRHSVTRKALHLSTWNKWGTLFTKLLMVISSHYTTLLSNPVGSIHKHLPQSNFLLRRHMRGMWERNRFCCSTSWFTFDLPSNRIFVLEHSEKLNLCYNYKKGPHALRKSICVTYKLEK